MLYYVKSVFDVGVNMTDKSDVKLAPHVPSDIWVIVDNSCDGDGNLKLAALLEGRLAVMEYEWIWFDHMCAP
jgi:hypothetical protein